MAAISSIEANFPKIVPSAIPMILIFGRLVIRARVISPAWNFLER